MEIKFFMTASGRSPVEEFVRELSDQTKAEFFDAVSLLASKKKLGMPLSRPLSNIYRGLHELRFRDRTGQIRFFYYIKKGDAIYFLHALKKKTQAIPNKVKTLILKRVREV